MKIINFIYQYVDDYSNILESFVSQITRYLPEYQITKKSVKNCLNVFFFTENNSSGGVFIPHGIADKNYRNADKLQGFDHVIVSGPLWADKLARQGYPSEKVLIGGYCKMDPLFQGKYKRKPSGSKPRILYAPTHGAISEVSIYGRFENCLKNLSKYFEILTSNHPSKSSDKAVTMQALIDADAVIADSGSMIYEAWALGKPVVFPDWLVKKGVFKYFPGSFEDQIYREEIGYHAKISEDLLETINLALINGINDGTKRFIDKIFPVELRGNSGIVTANLLKELIGEMSFNCPVFINEFKEYVEKLQIRSALEVGALSGELMDSIGAKGIDNNPSREDVQKCDIRKYQGKKCDLVFSSGLIEHYGGEEAIEVLKSMAKASNKYILTYTPNTNCAAYMTAKKNSNAPWNDELDFTPETLAALHEKAGLVVIDKGVAGAEWTKLFGQEPSEPYLVWVLAEKEEVPKDKTKTKKSAK